MDLQTTSSTGLINYEGETAYIDPHKYQWQALNSHARFVFILAGTMGGKIKIDEDFRSLESKQAFPGKNTIKVQIGEGATDSHIALKTMGGDIKVRKIEHEN